MHSLAAIPKLPQGKFFGQTLKQHQAGGFSLSETHYQPGTRLPRHSHESHYFCFVLRGGYREVYEQKVRRCEPSMILYHPAGELHAQSFDKTVVHLFRVEVNPKRLGYENQPGLRINSRDFRGGLPIGLANKLYQEFSEPDDVSHLAIEGLGLELIAALARNSQRRAKTAHQPPRWLSQAFEVLKSCYLERLTLGDIAATVGVHPVTLAREFRRHYHCTVSEVVRQERIEFACRELLKPEVQLADVAIAAGFYDQSHFQKNFKRLLGITPTQYRVGCRPR